MPGKSARRTGGGQHARTGYDAAKKRRDAEGAQQAARARSASGVKQSKHARTARSGGSDGSPAPVGRAKAPEAQREWNDPIWQVQGPGDSPTPEDTFALRVGRVLKTCTENWPENAREPPPDKSACEKQLQKCAGHAGFAISALLPPSAAKSSVTVEGLKDEDSPVLPEFMVQKINDLGTQLEAQQKESEEIHRKFQMVDKSENGVVDAKEFETLVRQLGLELTDEEIAQAFTDIDENRDGSIDAWEFEGWVKQLVRQDAKYVEGLSRIGRKRGWAKIKIPHASMKKNASGRPSRTQKFLAPKKKKLKPTGRYWLEVIGSRLSIYDSEDRVEEFARLQLSDMEVESVEEEDRQADGWGDESGSEKKGAFNAVSSAAQTAVTAASAATHGLLQHNEEVRRTVIALYLRLEGGGRHRVAIDIEPGNSRESSVSSWVQSMRLGLSYQGRQRSAKQLWDSLSKRLKLLVQMQKQYGDIHDMYGYSESDFAEVPIPKYIRDPDSLFSGFWDLLQLVMLLLVCYYVPLRTGFGVTVELWSYDFWQDAVIDIYFIIDIVIQFRTAYWSRSGVLVTDTRKIRNNYLKGWFLIDFVCVLPLGYVGYIFSGDGENGGFRAVKSLRLLRMGKMMRLAKVYKMLQKYDNVAELKPLIAIFGLIFLVALASHLLACFWFLIGVNDQVMVPENGDPSAVTVLEGWVNQKAGDDAWWGAKGQNATLKTRYVTSMYGIFNALENGYTDDEKLFAICAELIVGSVIYGGLAAVLSAAMMESQQASEEFNTNYKKLKTWMTSRKLKGSYQNMVLKAYSHKFKDSTTFDEEKLLADLPPAMASGLMDKLYGQFINDVPYFRGLDKVILIKLASSTKPLTAAKESLIMEEGKVGHEMFILVEGEVMVEKQGIELGYFRKPGSFFGENPIVDPRGTERRTRSVKAVTDCFLIYLERDTINSIADQYPELQARLRRFQRLGQRKRRDHEAAKLALEQTLQQTLHEPDNASSGDGGEDAAGGVQPSTPPRDSPDVSQAPTSRGSDGGTALQTRETVEALQTRVGQLERKCSLIIQWSFVCHNS
eukprot:COSAG02_NODE_1260_length_13563_cov_28.883764_3_plen_1060_part_00